MHSRGSANLDALLRQLPYVAVGRSSSTTLARRTRPKAVRPSANRRAPESRGSEPVAGAGLVPTPTPLAAPQRVEPPAVGARTRIRAKEPTPIRTKRPQEGALRS